MSTSAQSSSDASNLDQGALEAAGDQDAGVADSIGDNDALALRQCVLGCTNVIGKLAEVASFSADLHARRHGLMIRYR